MKRQEVIEKIISLNKVDDQLFKAMEECAELIQAISKVKIINNKDSYMNLVEEIADVTIMINELKVMFNIIDTDVNDMINYKLRRTANRMGFEVGELE